MVSFEIALIGVLSCAKAKKLVQRLYVSTDPVGSNQTTTKMGSSAKEHMEDVNLLPPSSKRAKLSAESISELPDSLMAKIFSYLPFKDRHQLCLVSSKWAATSRIPWTGVTFVNLSAIPRAMMNPILGLCPKITGIEATNKVILLEKKASVSVHENVRTMKLRRVNFAPMNLVHHTANSGAKEATIEMLSEHFGRFPHLTDLTLQSIRAIKLPLNGAASEEAENGDSDAIKLFQPIPMPTVTATSLRCFILINCPLDLEAGLSIDVAFTGMCNLECLYCEGNGKQNYVGTFDLPQLRELCLVETSYRLDQVASTIASGKFPKLEVFVFASRGLVMLRGLTQLITASSALRILVVAGRDMSLHLALIHLAMQGLHIPEDTVRRRTTLPPRRRPAVAGAADDQERQPPLQIFVGGDIVKQYRFTVSPCDVSNFWRIDCPMPEYLAKPDVAEVFMDVWLSQVIREGPKNGLSPWGHPDEMELFYSSEQLSFTH